jgi:hypothetical protein
LREFWKDYKRENRNIFMPEQFDFETSIGAAVEEEEVDEFGREREEIDMQFCREMAKIEDEIADLAKEKGYTIWQIKGFLEQVEDNLNDPEMVDKEISFWQRLAAINRKREAVENGRYGSLQELNARKKTAKEER